MKDVGKDEGEDELWLNSHCSLVTFFSFFLSVNVTNALVYIYETNDRR